MLFVGNGSQKVPPCWHGGEIARGGFKSGSWGGKWEWEEGGLPSLGWKKIWTHPSYDGFLDGVRNQITKDEEMCPIKYYTNMRLSKDPRLLRYEMVRYARDNGVKPAARAFNTTPKTVRKWLKRWQLGSLRGLEDQSKAPKNKKSGIDPDQRQRAIQLKRKLKSRGALRIKREFNLSLSEKAIRSRWIRSGWIRKIWKEEGLLKRKRRKHKTKNDLRQIKTRWRLF